MNDERRGNGPYGGAWIATNPDSPGCGMSAHMQDFPWRPVRRHPMLDHPYGRAARPAETVTLLLCARMSAVLNVALVAFIVVAYFLKRLH